MLYMLLSAMTLYKDWGYITKEGLEFTFGSKGAVREVRDLLESIALVIPYIRQRKSRWRRQWGHYYSHRCLPQEEEDATELLDLEINLCC